MAALEVRYSAVYRVLCTHSTSFQEGHCQTIQKNTNTAIMFPKNDSYELHSVTE